MYYLFYSQFIKIPTSRRLQPTINKLINNINIKKNVNNI